MRASEFVAKEVNAGRSEDQLDEMGEMDPLHYLRACEQEFLVVMIGSPRPTAA